MTPASTFDLDLLLREDAWLRAFLRRLVDRDDVDDVVQQTWLAALQRPVALREPRAWLSALAANLARLLHRRNARQAQRERRVARGATLPATADTVARLEVQRCVAGAVCALPEPTRSALLLHYHDGLDAAAIAEQIGGTPASVRKRLQRGRERVRLELQRQFGSDWRGSPVVLAFAAADPARRTPINVVRTAPALLPIAAVTTAVASVLVAALCIVLPERAMAAPLARNAILAATSGAPAQSAVDVAASTSSRTLVDWQDPAPPQERPIVVRGRCLAEEDKTPLAGVEVSAQAILAVDHPDRARRLKERWRLVTERDGRFEFSIERPAEEIRLSLTMPKRMERMGSFAVGTQPIDLGDILISRVFAVRVRTMGHDGAPASGVAVEVPLPMSLNDRRIHADFKSDQDGWLRSLALPAGKHTFSARVDGAWRLLDDVVVVRDDPAGTDVGLRVERLPSLCGSAFDRDGNPVRNLQVEAVPAGAAVTASWCAVAMTRADGSFELYYRGERPDDEVNVRFGSSGPFEPITAPGTYKWNTGHLKLEVVRAQELTLRVVERESQRPVEAFKVELQSRLGSHWQSGAQGESQRHANGTFVVERILRGRNVIVVVPRDPMLAPSNVLMLDSDGTVPAPVGIEVQRMRPITVAVVDHLGAPMAATAVDVMDPRGSTDFDAFDDHRLLIRCMGGDTPSLRLSTGTTDGDGKVSLLAPPAGLDLRVVVRRSAKRGDNHVQALPALPAIPVKDEVVRVAVPAR